MDVIQTEDKGSLAKMRATDKQHSQGLKQKLSEKGPSLEKDSWAFLFRVVLKLRFIGFSVYR